MNKFFKKRGEQVSDEKNKVMRNIRLVFIFYFTILVLLVMHILNFYLVDKFEIVNRTLNPRVFLVEEDIVKGSILDRNNNVLASSEKDIDSRIYLEYPDYLSFSHILGFITNGGLGLEANYSLTLQKMDNEFLDRLENLFTSNDLHGQNIKLTIDGDFQKYVHSQISNVSGAAIVIMEPSTGKILALSSSPSFNPNEINYEQTNNDTKYLNRSVQGTYPPGSIFKILSALTIMRNDENYDEHYYTCTGSVTIDGATISCYNNNAHGEVNLSKAIEKSCNTYFANRGYELGIEPLDTVATSLGFNKAINFDLLTKISKISTDTDMSTLELMQTYIGQGNTLVTPFQMATIYSGIANGGIIMKPYLVESVLDEDMNEEKIVKPEILNSEITAEEAKILNEMFVSVVNSGTATTLSNLNFQVAGKTGSAEASNDETHGWFAGYAPADNPQIALAVIFEDSGGSSATMSTVYNIFDYYLNN